MLNVDGVIHGNNRCSLSGVDLNRTWKEPNKVNYKILTIPNYFLIETATMCLFCKKYD